MTIDIFCSRQPCLIHNHIRKAAGVISRVCRFAAASLGPSAVDRTYINVQAGRYLDEYGGSILRLAYSYLHNISDAEDILQDTLIQYLKTAPVLESVSHEKAWLLRVAVHLFYYESYTTAQIAEILERKESTMRSDLRRGRAKLKEILKGEYDFEKV